VLQRIDATAGDDPAIRALVLTPTRELAAQIGESFATYGENLDLWHTVIFGGVKENPQIAELKRGVDVLIATPGRLLDLMGQGHVNLTKVEIFVLDEADRMLDMGFLPDVKRVVKALPQKRQTLFFSATMPPVIRELAESLLTTRSSVAVAPVSSATELVTQQVFFVDHADKRSLLVDLLKRPEVTRTLVFTRTKHGANRIVEHLEKAKISAAGHPRQQVAERTHAGHGRLPRRLAARAGGHRPRSARHRRERRVARHQLRPAERARDLRAPHRSYGRAEETGIAWALCEDEDRPFLADIERLIGHGLTRVEGGEFADDPRAASNVSASNVRPPARPQPARGGQRGPRPASRGRGRGPGPGTGSRR
jgi:ATP-dependent RNA helicase RhlE